MADGAAILLFVERGHPAMHVAKIERRHGERVYTYWLVRRSVREGKRVRHETVANVSKLPAAALEALRRALAGRHLAERAHVLYDVSSSYFEGRTCPLLALGYSRDGRRGTPQIVYGLLCDREGRPLAIEVFAGGLHDDKTLPGQIEKLRRRFGLTTLVLVIDRGMATKANLETLASDPAIGWITALKAPQVKRLVKQGSLQLSLFDQTNLAEIASADYPGERLVVCPHPLVPAERA